MESKNNWRTNNKPKGGETREWQETTDKKPRGGNNNNNWNNKGGKKHFDKPPYTHFFSLPLYSCASLTDAFAKWQQEILSANYNQTIIDKLFQNPKLFHLTLCMLPLEKEGKLDGAKKVLSQCEDQIKEMIKTRGVNGKLAIEYSGVGHFGTPEATTVIYLQIKEEGAQFELLKDIQHLLVDTLLKEKVVFFRDLSHIHFNKETQKYEQNKYHLTLMNSTFASKQLIEIHGDRTFKGAEIIANNLSTIAPEPSVADTIELSTRYNTDEKTGFYTSQLTIGI